MKFNKIISHYDLDGVVSAALLSYKTGIKNIRFVESIIYQRIDKKTILSDLEYSPKCGMWFDHHISNKTDKRFKGLFALEKSCARVIYNYYNKEFSDYFKNLVDLLDKADSGSFTKEDVQQQTSLYLLNMAGLFYPFKNKKIKNKLLNKLLEQILQEKEIDEIVEEPVIKETITNYKKELKKTLNYIKKEKRIINKKILYLDSSKKLISDPFAVYIQNPQIIYFMKVTPNKKKNQIGIFVAKNKYKKVKSANIGEIMKKYAGGGHPGIGGCRIPKKDKNKIIPKIIKALT